jgi:hypothetical protein
MGREGGLWAMVLATGPGRGASEEGEVPLHLRDQPDGSTLLHNALQRAACLVPERRLVARGSTFRALIEQHLLTLALRVKPLRCSSLAEMVGSRRSP